MILRFDFLMRLIFILFFFCEFVYAQENDINSCSGSIRINEYSEINVAFKGFKGEEKGNEGLYLNKTVSKNSVWFLYEPEKNGQLRLNCRIYLDSFDFMVLKTNMYKTCEEIKNMNATPLLIKPNTTCEELNNAVIDVQNGYYYTIVFFAKDRDDSNIYLELEFEENQNDQEDFQKPVVLNLVYDNTKPVYRLTVLDQESNSPVSSRITISGSNELNGTYSASHLFLNLNSTVRSGVFKIDAIGYLSKDVEDKKISFSSSKLISDTIFLKKLKRGTVAKLDKIYFTAGKATILEESEYKIKRLRDFLVLNSSIKIEIQGHVNLDGNKKSAMRLSKKRAKEIKKYLVSQGVNKSRLSAVGFGATKMVYINPSSEKEKEANRRVEIMIR